MTRKEIEQIFKELNEMYGTDVHFEDIDDFDSDESEIAARMIFGESFDSASQHGF